VGPSQVVSRTMRRGGVAGSAAFVAAPWFATDDPRRDLELASASNGCAALYETAHEWTERCIPSGVCGRIFARLASDVHRRLGPCARRRHMRKFGRTLIVAGAA